ncbi:LuxR C-terminal-related transcriptional regulator [Desulfuribacillus alkaliarsenatis]|uniref:LuxR C-terminal-related transcriptional regulator n=1 Tax=Desulfuribacillus alkaliarsenatis TaxID=766136 RepID=UPI0015B4132B|nr:LuxR C-terminal-related transcriptional regulator [Desulfuribacillus alkaliarsenatis]
MIALLRNDRIKLISFSLFFGWLLAVPFEGQVLYRLLELSDIEGSMHTVIAVFAHFLGLIVSGFLINRQYVAKMTMVIATVICILGSLVFFLSFSMLWNLALINVAFFSGMFVACWGWFFKYYTRPGQRLAIAAEVLIWSNVMMIFINVIANNVSAVLALSVAIVGLLMALLVTFSLDDQERSSEKVNIDFDNINQNKSTIGLKPIVILGLFIFIITINSGLMYQVVNPAFSHFTLLTSYFWALPYILVILIIRNIAPKTNMAYILYVALAMLGISYILFMVLDISIASYLLINTFMLGAFGVFDLFWWSILGKFLEHYKNPIKVWGIGLSMNVLGILIGGYVGAVYVGEGEYIHASIVALAVICTAILILPILNNQLANTLKGHVFLYDFAPDREMAKEIALTKEMALTNEKEILQESNMLDFKQDYKLTDREMEITELLVRGYTYKAIAKTLFISENTMKYHAKNIYQKLNVKSKMELIRLLSRNSNSENKQ